MSMIVITIGFTVAKCNCCSVMYLRCCNCGQFLTVCACIHTCSQDDTLLKGRIQLIEVPADSVLGLEGDMVSSPFFHLFPSLLPVFLF